MHQSFLLHERQCKRGNTNLRHGHHLNLDAEIWTFIDDDTSLAFLGNGKRRGAHFGPFLEKGAEKTLRYGLEEI